MFLERQDSILRRMNTFYYERAEWAASDINCAPFAQRCIFERKKFLQNPELLQNELKEFYIQSKQQIGSALSDEDLSGLSSRILTLLKIDEAEIREMIVKKRFNAEFGMKIGYLNDQDVDSYVALDIQDNKIEIKSLHNSDVKINNFFNIVKGICYIDDPFILDELNSQWLWLTDFQGEYDHRNHLLKKLRNVEQRNDFGALDELVTENKLKQIFSTMSSVCDGELCQSDRGHRRSYGYKSPCLKDELEIANLSTGIKSFIILQTLLKNGSIQDQSVIVMDEPEIHLHPEWQLRFAELIVLLQKNFQTNILLNTHSPYFLNAIQVFSQKYKIADRCRYYLMEETCGRTEAVDVTNSTEAIYKKLARPLQELENLEYQDE